MNLLLQILLLTTTMLNQTIPPNDRDAERGLIGACLAGKFDDVRAAGVGAEHFFCIRCAGIWRTMNELDAERVTVSSDAVLHRAKGASDYSVTDVLDSEMACPTPLNWTYFASIVDEKRKARRVMEVGQRLSEQAAKAESPEQLVSEAEATIFGLNSSITAQKDTRGESFQRVVGILEEAHLGGQIGVPTGINDLDRVIGGMRGGQLITLAARPAVGKSAMACNIAEHLVMNGTPVAFFSFEMSDDELNLRMLCSLSDTNLIGDVVNRNVTDKATREKILVKAAAHAPKLRAAPLFINDNGNLTVAQIASHSRRLVRNHGIKVIIIDYMQLVQPSPHDTKAQRHVQVGNITRGLKQLAMELNIPVVGLAQLGRQVIDRPRLADLRESGSIEQDSDVVLFLYVDDPDMQSGPNMLVKLAIGKNRAGRQAEVDLVFVRNKLRFESAYKIEHEKWLNEKKKQLA